MGSLLVTTLNSLLIISSFPLIRNRTDLITSCINEVERYFFEKTDNKKLLL